MADQNALVREQIQQVSLHVGQRRANPNQIAFDNPAELRVVVQNRVPWLDQLIVDHLVVVVDNCDANQLQVVGGVAHLAIQRVHSMSVWLALWLRLSLHVASVVFRHGLIWQAKRKLIRTLAHSVTEDGPGTARLMRLTFGLKIRRDKASFSKWPTAPKWRRSVGHKLTSLVSIFHT
jgi:hypothetical protein